MSQINQALEVALAAARQLPLKLQRRLAEQLIADTTDAAAPGENIIAVYLQRLPQQKQARLAKLMDKNNGGQLNQSEQSELERLGAEVDQLLLANSYALARALRPELFDQRGQPVSAVFGKP